MTVIDGVTNATATVAAGSVPQAIAVNPADERYQSMIGRTIVLPLIGREIRIIADTLQRTLNTIKEQTDSLKDFVSHASHELKTPLMSLSAVMDAGQKTGNHEKTFASAKEILKNINNLFETLLFTIL